MTESLEMYMETIAVLREREKVVRVTDIAKALGVSKPSVHLAMHELVDRGYIRHEHYGEVYLSEAGLAEAMRIRERHALLTGFLEKTLGLDRAIAEHDACRIEHYLSEETMYKIKEYMKVPRTD